MSHDFTLPKSNGESQPATVVAADGSVKPTENVAGVLGDWGEQLRIKDNKLRTAAEQAKQDTTAADKPTPNTSKQNTKVAGSQVKQKR